MSSWLHFQVQCTVIVIFTYHMLIFSQLFLTVSAFCTENESTKQWSQEGGILAKLFFEFLWTDMKWRSIKTKKREREGEERGGRVGRDRTGSISGYPYWTEAYLFIIWQRKICSVLELSQQFRGADKIGPAWVGNKNSSSPNIWIFFSFNYFTWVTKSPFPLLASLMCDLHCKR